MKRSLATAFLYACLLSVVGWTTHAQRIEFDKETYVLEAGETATIRLAFAASIPDGLEAYALQVLFPEGLLELELAGVGIVAALDNDLLAENPAERALSAGSVEVAGFSPAGQPYGGLAFLELAVKVAPGTADGDYLISMAIPMPNSFVDGELNVLDDNIELDTAIIRVIPPGLQPRPPEVDPFTGTFQINFTGKPGINFALETSLDLQSWTVIETFAFDESGLYTHPVTVSSGSGMRFFRLRQL